MRRYAIEVACQEHQEPAEQHRQLGGLGPRHCFQIGESGPAHHYPVSEGANWLALSFQAPFNQYFHQNAPSASQLLPSGKTGGWMRV